MSSSDFERRLLVTAHRVQPIWKTDSYSGSTASSGLLSKPEIRYYVYLCQEQTLSYTSLCIKQWFW